MARFIITLAIIAFPFFCLAQSGSAPPAADPQLSNLTTFELYVKIGGAVIAGIVALIGLPIVLLTYKKTKAELIKLELEAQTLKQKLQSAGGDEVASSAQPKGEATLAETRINIDNSKDVNVQVLADPRLLGPLLLILNFIVAWVYLTLADRLLNIFDIGGGIILAVLSAVLLLPIAQQATLMTSSFKTSMSAEQIEIQAAATRRTRLSLFYLFVLCAVGASAFGAFLVSRYAPSGITELGRVLGWVALIGGVAALCCASYLHKWLKNKFQDV